MENKTSEPEKKGNASGFRLPARGQIKAQICKDLVQAFKTFTTGGVGGESGEEGSNGGKSLTCMPASGNTSK